MMRIAISSTGTDLDAVIDSRFGRAGGFVVVEEDGSTRPLSNEQNLQAAQGAGIQAAQNLIRAGVTLVITGHVGPKAFTTLSAAGIAVICGASGTGHQALEAYRSGALHVTQTADVEDHFGP